MQRTQDKSVETVKEIEREERSHMPEGEPATPETRQLGAAALLTLASVGVLAVGLTAYFVGGVNAMWVAIGLVVVYALVGAMPAWIAARSRAKREEVIKKRVETRVEEESGAGAAR